MITAHTPLPEDFMDVNGTNITNLTLFNDLCTFNASEQIEQVKLYVVNDGGGNIARRNLLQKKEDKLAPLCKCYCKLNITEEELMEAVKLLRLNANSTKIPLHSPLRNRKIGFTENSPLRSKQAFITSLKSPQDATGRFVAAHSTLFAHAQSADSASVRSNVQTADSGAQPVSKMASDEEIMGFVGGGLS